MVASPETSSVVRFWDRTFAILRRISVFDVLRRLRPAWRTAEFAEVWTAGHSVLALVALILAVAMGRTPVSVALVAYGFFRTFEIVVYQVNVLLFDWYRAARAGQAYRVRGYLRMLLLLLHNYAEIVLWFAASYAVLAPDIVLLPDRSVFGALYGSFRTMVSLGPAEVSASEHIGLLVIWTQSISGLLMTLFAFGRFLSLLPPIGSENPAEQ